MQCFAMLHFRIELQYVWMYLGRWHIAAFLKTTWFVVTIVTQKSSLYRICQTLSVRFFKTTERPFNTIAFYMLMTSYIMLPVVIDILSLYTFAERYRYGSHGDRWRERSHPAVTVTATSAVVMKPPSCAMTRSTYSPGSANVAVTGKRPSSGSGGGPQPGVHGESPR